MVVRFSANGSPVTSCFASVVILFGASTIAISPEMTDAPPFTRIFLKLTLLALREERADQPLDLTLATHELASRPDVLTIVHAGFADCDIT